MTISEFKPELLTGIKTYLFGIPVNNVNPNICASEQCGKDLAELFAQYRPTVTMQVPQWGTWRGHFGQTQNVAWLQFPNGAVVNCGTLADWWNRLPQQTDQAYRYAQMEVVGVIRDKDAENA